MSVPFHELIWQRFAQPALSVMTTPQAWCSVLTYSPAVVRVDGVYRMWYVGNSLHSRDAACDLGYAESEDGLHWERDPAPVVSAGGALRSVIYPWVLRHDGAYTMWYGAHVADDYFEIFCSTSDDGVSWTHHHAHSVFPATRRRQDFDGRFTSIPCVLQEDDRLLLYYSARDLDCLYGSQGRVGYDIMGVYRHIGVAVTER